MRAGSDSRWCCDHCGAPNDEAELMFVAGRGGIRPRICAACVEFYHDVLWLYRLSPQRAAEALSGAGGTA